MSAPYRSILQQIRLSFPQPVSDPIHDAYFVFSILRALDQIDGMKSDVPILGQARPLDYVRSRSARMADGLSTVEAVTAELVRQFRDCPSGAIRAPR
ncbi:MAG: hypothetical protein HY701_01210 [Gemmatimonadetes bacterium]|nr:hypothetical protein [Gemmatimonadota bacterium]